MKDKVKYIEAIRGIACLIVLVAHIISIHPKYGAYASGCGKIGVWCFMLLSGMLLILPYIENKDKRFLWKELPLYYQKKIVRIYPSFICALLVAYLMGFFSIADFSKYVFCRGAWGHFWYMPVIVKFYGVAPVFLVGFSLLKKYIPKFANIIQILILILMFCFFSIAFPYSTYIENSTALYWYIPVFIVGMLVAFLLSSVKTIRVSSAGMDCLTVIAVSSILIVTPVFRKLIWRMEPSGYLQNKYLYMAFCWSVIIFAVSRGRIAKEILEKSKFLRVLGSISYEVYLIHYLILNKIVQYSSSFWLQALLTTVCSLMFASLLFLTHSYAKKHLSMNMQFAVIVILMILVMLPLYANRI